jgi:hypothetical protein
MNAFTIILLFFNLVLMVVSFFVTKHNFSQNKYADNMKAEVSKLIGEIQNQTETCVRVLEDAISRANETVKAAENRLEIINKELAKQKSEVVVLDALMSNNSEKVKSEKTAKKAQEIKIYSGNSVVANKTSTEQTVLQMHSEGFSTGEISQQTGIPEGEVSLIISLAGR